MRNIAPQVNAMLREDPFLPVYMAVAKVIKSEIGSCRIPAGTHLKEVETAKDAGVSRTTVRRAFDILILEGLVIRHYPQGIEVGEMVPRTYAETAELRQMIDSFAGRMAAIRRTQADLDRMAEQVEALKRARTIDALTKADIAFHEAVYRAAGNRRVLEITEKYELDLTHAKYMSAEGVVPIRARIVAEHSQILRAIREQAPQKAFEASLRHAEILFDPLLMGSAFPGRTGNAPAAADGNGVGRNSRKNRQNEQDPEKTGS